MEVSFGKEIESLRLGAGDTFHGEGILAITKALLQSGVAYVGGYQGKSLLLKLKSDAPGVEVVFKDDGGMGISPVNVQPFLNGDVMYGYDEGGKFRAVSATTGERLWDSPGPIGPPRVRR